MHTTSQQLIKPLRKQIELGYNHDLVDVEQEDFSENYQINDVNENDFDEIKSKSNNIKNMLNNSNQFEGGTSRRKKSY